jgi:hypothetical protein
LPHAGRLLPINAAVVRDAAGVSEPVCVSPDVAKPRLNPEFSPHFRRFERQVASVAYRPALGLRTFANSETPADALDHQVFQPNTIVLN